MARLLVLEEMSVTVVSLLRTRDPLSAFELVPLTVKLQVQTGTERHGCVDEEERTSKTH